MDPDQNLDSDADPDQIFTGKMDPDPNLNPGHEHISKLTEKNLKSCFLFFYLLIFMLKLDKPS